MKIKSMFLGLLVACLASAAALATGGTWSNVTVAQYTPFSTEGNPNNIVVVKLSANSSGGPSCASSFYNFVAIDVSTTAGAYAAGVLQAARLNGGTVTIGGVGTCGLDSGVETLAYVEE